MAKVNELVDKVINKETSALEEDVERKRFDLKNALVAKEAETQRDLVSEKEKIDKKMQEQHQIAVQSRQIVYRDQLLTQKQALIEELFDAALKELDNLPQETFRSFVLAILKQFEGQGDLTLVLGSYSKGLIDQSWLESLAIEGVNIQLAADTIQSKGGFILEKLGSQYNFLNDSLIEEVRTQLIIDISKSLNP
ncbi:hypothetical protein [Fundicoccus culcitae]|uniref:V-type ATP synthase subunit E n=1 Tax=Fundicoccus culcitae TaxID=2969821 RepID=A0ABY5P5G0_9LACT|nr:hypothetical protein [Fundicoccus culcitae]UUX33643.1 hypothetical protein NRE15_12155 [Fundicoccus culcitae]